MRVAAIQHDIAWEDPASTFEMVEPLIAEAVESGAELVAVTEMFSTGFSMRATQIAEPIHGPAASFLVDRARHHEVTLVGSVPTRHPDYDLPVNLATVAHADGRVEHYAKIHPFSFAGEDLHYSPGSSFLTTDVGGVRCTFFICYDLRFADEFWATAAETDCYVVVANWPAARQRHWDTLLRARAIENQAYVLAANRIGVDGNDLAYGGGSTLIDPLGEIVDVAYDESAIVRGDVDPSVVADIRARFPFANDRR